MLSRLFFFSIIGLTILSIHSIVQARDLAAIQQAGILRVGTTLDYPPFTFYNSNTKQYSGSDVDIARRFANTLGVNVVIVQTSWATLNQDLQNGKFDMAVGGISVNSLRSKLFLLSNPIGYSGKVPLQRCDNKNRYQTIAQINHPDVIVVENIGGTNQQFAKKYLTQSHLIWVVDNEAAFKMLSTKRADVMITDNVEALYRHHTMPELCPVNPNRPFTHDAKVFLFQKSHTQLLKKFNQWLTIASSKP